tara:strand:- start:2452 stop:2967 length:516 start_codon:yes stop_codon:yes gene_type:complete
MYLQLAENPMTDNYTPVETNQGTIYMRNDLLNEGTTLAAGGRGLQIAAKVVGAAGKFVPLPGAAAISGVASNILNKAGQAKAAGGSGIQAATSAIPAGTGAKLKAAISKLKLKGAAPAQVAIPETIAAKTAAEETAPPPSFFQRYRTPILIGGGLLVAGTAIYLLTKKKKR